MYENKVEDILKAQSGNKEIMTKLVTENSNLIWSIVTRFKDRGYEVITIDFRNPEKMNYQNVKIIFLIIIMHLEIKTRR